MRRQRDAALLLNLAVLLSGGKTSKEKVWKHLAAIISGQPEKTREDDVAELKAKEREPANFTQLNEFWLDADPDDGAGDDDGEEVDVWQIAQND